MKIYLLKGKKKLKGKTQVWINVKPWEIEGYLAFKTRKAAEAYVQSERHYGEECEIVEFVKMDPEDALMVAWNETYKNRKKRLI